MTDVAPPQPDAGRDERVGPGRPTREQAEQRHELLLDRALEIFLEKGFEMATIDTIAAAVGMTKRTVYARYEDKRALFRATVQRAVDRWTLPTEALRVLETDDLEETLTAIGLVRMRNTISPAGLRLQRIINAESYRFPDIFLQAYSQGTVPARRYLADLFTRFAAKGEAFADQPDLLATAFMTLVVGGSTRSIVLGNEIDEAKAEQQVRFNVRLFLNGVRPR